MYTRVYELFTDGQRNDRLLFGLPTRTHRIPSAIGTTARAHDFAPGERFALDLWSRNAYGTIRWRVFVCETVTPGMDADRVPFVMPGATVLICTRGAAQSRLVLAWLARLEALGVNLRTCPANVFIAASLRLQGLRADTAAPAQLSACPVAGAR